MMIGIMLVIFVVMVLIVYSDPNSDFKVEVIVIMITEIILVIFVVMVLRNKSTQMLVILNTFFHQVVGWKGKASVRAYVPRNDRLHYLR